MEPEVDGWDPNGLEYAPEATKPSALPAASGLDFLRIPFSGGFAGPGGLNIDELSWPTATEQRTVTI